VNRKGSIISFPLGLISLFVLILVMVVLMPIQMDGTEPEKMYSVLDNVSQNTLGNFNVSEANSPIVNIAHSFIHFMLYASFEVIKAAVKYAVDNPSFINAHNLLWLIIVSMLIPIIYHVFMMLVIIFLLVKEWYLNKKERRIIRDGNILGKKKS